MFKFQLSNNFCKVSATVIDFGQTFAYIALFDLRITGELVNLLRFNSGYDTLVEKLREVCLKFLASKVLENLFPFRWLFKVPHVWLNLACQDLHCSGFTKTISSYQTKDLTNPGRWQTMKLKSIRAISMDHLIFKSMRKVNYFYCLKRAFFATLLAINAHLFVDDANC